MSNASNDTTALAMFDAMFDPWAMFRQMRDAYLESAAQTMVELVKTEEYAQATGSMLSTYLDFAEPVRAWMDKMMPQVLAQYGLPSRKEVISVASRLNSIEMRLDDLAATLAEIRQALQTCEHTEQKAA